jgi:hypothetical protein
MYILNAISLNMNAIKSGFFHERSRLQCLLKLKHVSHFRLAVKSVNIASTRDFLHLWRQNRDIPGGLMLLHTYKIFSTSVPLCDLERCGRESFHMIVWWKEVKYTRCS